MKHLNRETFPGQIKMCYNTETWSHDSLQNWVWGQAPKQYILLCACVGGGVWFPKYKPLPIHTEAHMSRPVDLPLWGKKISNHISASLFSYLTYIFPK